MHKANLPYPDEVTVRQGDTVPNEIFLYDVSQPFDHNETRAGLFRKDLSKFIGLSEELPPLEVRETSENEHYEIDICEGKFKALRENLMKTSIDASNWISQHFMEHPDITVSSPEYFKAVLQTWLTDPCDEEGGN
jgi:hypothetical protein